ncbi:MAG TPA: hypothetical protein VGH69_11455 [Mycobacterium sp.]|jgi:hypothetical protein
MTSPIEELAQQLMREGYLDNEADARLAAIEIILAVERPVAKRSRSTCGVVQAEVVAHR